MNTEYKKMWRKVLTNVAISLLLTTFVITIAVIGLRHFYTIELQVRSLSLFLAITGTVLAFSGNNLVSDAVSRYDAPGLPQWKWGNRLQSVGYALTITALLVR